MEDKHSLFLKKYAEAEARFAIRNAADNKRRQSPYEVGCPKCGSPALAPCRFPSGMAVLPHQARLKVVARIGEQPVMHDRPKLWVQMKNLAKQLETD